nr:hypothetical protein [Bartonella raoultii]
MQHDKASSFVIAQKAREETPAEVTMSDIAQKLRSVYAKMQMKHKPHHFTPLSSAEERFKSYLDDISRAILAEHYMRRQKEKKLFESLEQIKMLLQALHGEKKNVQTDVTRQISRSQLPHSVVQYLAQMASEENQQCTSLKERAHFAEQKNVTISQTNSVNMSQHGNKDSLAKGTTAPFVKENQKIPEDFAKKERYSDAQTSTLYLADKMSVSSFFKKKMRKTFFFLRYSVKKLLSCFLTIAFMAAITLCFYSFLRGARFL